MSYAKHVELWCDACAKWILPKPLSEKVRIARKLAEGKGWTHTFDGKDYCPVCSAKRLHEKAILEERYHARSQR